MNASVKNRVQLLGNLGKDPQVMEVKSGKMARISLATTEFRKTGKNEYETETQWHNVVLWGKQAELAEKFLKKGSRVLIEGKIQNRSYQDKSGQKKYATDIVALDLVLLGGKPAA
jgi:single-strand DNA-binding protein